MPRRRSVTSPYLACSAHLQTPGDANTPYRFLFKWMATSAAPNGDLHPSDLYLPVMGDSYTLTLTDTATGIDIYPPAGTPDVVPQNDYEIATYAPLSLPPPLAPINKVVDQPQKVRDIIANYLPSLDPTVVAARCAAAIATASRVNAHLDGAWNGRCDSATLDFAKKLYPLVSRHYRGRHTDFQNGVRQPNGAFTTGFDAAYGRYRSQMALAMGGAPPLLAEAQLLEAIMGAVKSDMADAANQYNYLIMSGLTGVDVPQSANPTRPPAGPDGGIGQAFGLEAVIDLKAGLITTQGQAGLKDITLTLTLKNAAQGRNATQTFPNCLKTADRMTKMAATPVSYIVEDGWFSEPTQGDGSEPGTSAVVFHPTCGDGAVQICVALPLETSAHMRETTADNFTAFTIYQLGVTQDPAAQPNNGVPAGFSVLGQYSPYSPTSTGASPLPASDMPGGRRELLPREAQFQLRVDPVSGALILQDPRRYTEGVKFKPASLGSLYYFWSRAKQMNGFWTDWQPVQRLGADGKHCGLDAPSGTSAASLKVLAASSLPPVGQANVALNLTANGGGAAYDASVSITNAPALNSDGTPTGETFNELNSVSAYRVMLMAKIPELTWDDPPPAALAARIRAVDADLPYLQQSLWYTKLTAAGWLFVSITDDIPPKAGGAPNVSMGTLPPGYHYQAIVVAKRDPGLCYSVPATPAAPGQPGRNYFPSGKVVHTAAGNTWVPSAARSRSLAIAATDRVIPLRFDISEPSFTAVQDAPVVAPAIPAPVFSSTPITRSVLAGS
jgi:hypothetical protein